MTTKKRHIWAVVFFVLCLGLTSPPVQAIERTKNCQQFNDAFDYFDFERWQEVLFYSVSQGNVAVDDGRLFLKTTDTQPSEIQIYALFVFQGDFDIQADYALDVEQIFDYCRFNSGIILQTLGDEKSYKCYIAKKPGKDLVFRSRLDHEGESNIEMQKRALGRPSGTIRVTRKAGRITFHTQGNNEWKEIYTFNELCTEDLRLRFKLQTQKDKSAVSACKIGISFDNFVVNSCESIIQ